MSIDVGSTVEGTIVKLADYGAIVRLQGGKTGLIHISEIADTFVRDVKEHFKEQDRVRVKVLGINSKGRYELSTKQVEQPPQEESPSPPPPAASKKPVERPREVINLGPEGYVMNAQVFTYGNFEDKLSQFMKDSQDRLLDIKRNIETKRGIKRR